ncbi:ComEA family DNA-binding protein [Salipaludibacillus sp. HK11]|uniref:ComEA family DNA-binding protein n=1 Tax=Salipaludibacillus sp. HK11 TaxID=3394320 RepID=UPI0039FBC99A
MIKKAIVSLGVIVLIYRWGWPLIVRQCKCIQAEQPTYPPTTTDAETKQDLTHKEGIPHRRNDKIEVNEATLKELMEINGVGDRLAEKILEDRTANGRYNTVQDLLRVNGIGEKKLKTIIPYVEVE